MTQLDYKFNIGIAAISWVNDDIPGLGDETTVETVLKEMQELGYIATEKGRTFPDDVEQLKSLLQTYNIRLASQFISTKFTKGNIEEELSQFEKSVLFLKEMGCKYVIVCEMGGSTHWDIEENQQERKTPKKLSEKEWGNLVHGLNKAGKISSKHGLTLVYHAHAATVVEQKDELKRLMEDTDKEYVSLLYDTGHALYGNYNPLELLKNHRERIKYIHFKDVRKQVLKKCRKNGNTFREEVVKGIFTVPGDGDIDFKEIMEELIRTNYKGWIIVEAEQDPEKANPYEYAKKAMAYLKKTEYDILQKINA